MKKLFTILAISSFLFVGASLQGEEKKAPPAPEITAKPQHSSTGATHREKARQKALEARANAHRIGMESAAAGRAAARDTGRAFASVGRAIRRFFH